MTLSPGSRLGAYEVLDAIGRGGMGEVYRARDTKLHRHVALKVLPESFATDPERLARFTREARTLAALNDPHIAAIYGLEDHDGVRALIIELVEGEDLSERIRRGPIPVDEALLLAKQIAEALETAHEHGIIHRDLKPANIKVRADGTVKVLDFGLAKAREPTAATQETAATSPTTTPATTRAGMILGTAAYMSPEQARGRTVDKRTDIWAFGAVLFEMLTGKRAFPGEDVADTLAAIVRAEPDWSLLPRDVSPTTVAFLHQCLHKDPRRRIGDIHDVWLTLEGAFDALSMPATQDGVRSVSRIGERVVWAAALGVVFVALLALAVFAWRSEAPVEVRPVRFFVSLPDGWRVTTALNQSGSSPAPLAAAPDGSRIAFVATSVMGRSRLWVRALDALNAQELPGTDGATSPFWAPDSRSLGFFADGKLKKIAISGGPPVTLCDSADNVGGSWSRDDVIVFSPGTSSALQKVAASGGMPSAATVLAAGESYHGRPTFLPDGRHFIYRVGNGGTYVTSLDSTVRTLVTANADSTNVLYAKGQLLFLRETTLMAQPFDLKRLTLTGEPVPVAEQIQTTANNPNGLFSASDTGVLVYQSGAPLINDRQLTWFDRSGKTLSSVEKPGQYNTVALSPDGSLVAVSRAASPTSAATDIWVHEFARATSTRITSDPGQDWMAVWSPDGSRLVWTTNRDGNYNLYQKASSGAGLDEPLLKSSDQKYSNDWSLDGRFLLYSVSSSHYSLHVLPLTGDNRTPTLYLEQSGFNVSQGRFSPDGRYVAYTSNASGRSEVYVQPFPTPAGGKWMVSQGGGNQPRWRRDGKELFYISADSKVMAVPIATSPTFTQRGAPTALFPAPIWGGSMTLNTTRYDVTADGQKFLINVLPQEMTPTAPAPITVVLNWTAALTR